VATTLTGTSQRLARTWREPLGRAGIATRGVLYLLLGFLAIQFARGEVSGTAVNQTGAFETVARQPLGKVLLVLVVLGLAAMCVFSVIQAVTGDPVEGDEASKRAKFAGRAIIYGSLTVTAIKVTVDAWSAGPDQTAAQNAGDQQQQQTTSTLFDLPAGRLIVVVVGLVLIGMAAFHIWHSTVQAKFMKRIAPPPRIEGAVKTLGRVGYTARSVVFMISGIFFVVAAAQYDPNDAKGISGSLRELAQNSWGRALLWGTAIGLFAFGVFCLAEARYRRHA
jgi:O-antigen ligase